MKKLRLGFILNPLAGTGGPLANKGSDNLQLINYLHAEDELNALRRAIVFLRSINTSAEHIVLVTVAGLMGEEAATQAGFTPTLIDFQPPRVTAAVDTISAARQIIQTGVDILVFAGGDGTARDICQLITAEFPEQLVLGVPAGVKMQSAVYAVNPQAAAELIGLLARGNPLHVVRSEVRDIDEAALRIGQIKSRHYGQMLTPYDGRFVQQVKQGGAEVEELILLDIAEYLKQLWDDNTLLIFGPGSTLFNIQHNLGLPATLLGFDVVKAGVTLSADASTADLQALIDAHVGKVLVFITAIGGQGHIIGRGNQQLSPAILRGLGKSAMHVVCTKNKLSGLEGRSLFMDSGDAQLDASWQGFIPVICGYEETVLYPLGHG